MAAFLSRMPAGASHKPHESGEHCPWCEQPIPNDKLAEISKRIAAREHEQAAELEARLAKEKAAIEAKAAAEVEKLTRESAARETSAREAGKLAAAAELQSKLTETAERASASEKQLLSLKAEQETLLSQRLLDQRQQLETAKANELAAEKLKAYEDKLKFEHKLADLQRQLQNKTAEELGDSAEVDLFEMLKAEFVEDRIARVEKGAAGVDIIHDVYQGGRYCGRIVYDAKNRNAWRNDYVSKLLQDQIAAKADHAILSSKVFPGGVKHLHMQDGVIVVMPSRVLVLANLLRRHIIQTATMRLSNEERSSKTEALYSFIVSDRCTQYFEALTTHTDGMLDLENKEKRAHETTWKRRNDLIRSVQRVQSQLTTEIDGIIGTKSA